MATLQQTLRGLPKADDQLTRGPGGVLQRAPTLQQATKQTGVAAGPTTPLAARLMGAGPQAAKMAGTPQQMQATLDTALRTKQYGREATEQEAAAMQKSTDMQKLGGLGDRVADMVKAEFKKTAGTAGEVDLNAELDIIRKDPNSQEAMDAMLRLVQSGQKLDDIAKLVPEAATAIGNVAKGLIRDPSTVKAAEFLPQLGYDAQSLATLLGVTPKDVEGYSLKDLENKVNEITTQEFTQSQQLQQQAVSPIVGAAERQLAREAGRELSAVGVRASEADMQRLNDSVARADQVSMFGETRSVAGWLADDEVSALIKEIVESPEGSDLRKQVEQEAGDFYKFITDNELALKDAAADLDTSSTAFKGIQTTNTNLYTRAGLSDEAAKLFAPSLTQPQSRVFTADEIPVIGYLTSLSDTERKTVVDVFNKLQATNPTLAAEVAKLSKDELIALGVGKPGSNWEKMIKHNAAVDTVQALKDDDVDGILAAAYEDMPSADVAQDYIDQGNALTALGFESGVALTSLDPVTLKQQVIDGLGGSVSVKDAAAGKVPETKKPKFGVPKNGPRDLDPNDLIIYNTLQFELLDGSLSADDINNPRGGISRLNWDDLLRLRELADKPGAKIDKPSLDAKLDKLRENNTAEEFVLVGGADRRNTNPALDIDRWAKLLQADPRKVNINTIKDLIYRTALGEFESGRYRFQYMDSTLERIKALGFLTPELVDKFNKAAAQRRTINNQYLVVSSKYPYGIDAQGNPLPPPPPPPKQTESTNKRRR